jgi:hypothetical protein
MRTVAILAEWSVLVTFLRELSMSALPECGYGPVVVFVTLATVYPAQRGVVRILFDPL